MCVELIDLLEDNSVSAERNTSNIIDIKCQRHLLEGSAVNDMKGITVNHINEEDSVIRLTVNEFNRNADCSVYYCESDYINNTIGDNYKNTYLIKKKSWILPDSEVSFVRETVCVIESVLRAISDCTSKSAKSHTVYISSSHRVLPIYIEQVKNPPTSIENVEKTYRRWKSIHAMICESGERGDCRDNIQTKALVLAIIKYCSDAKIKHVNLFDVVRNNRTIMEYYNINIDTLLGKIDINKVAKEIEVGLDEYYNRKNGIIQNVLFSLLSPLIGLVFSDNIKSLVVNGHSTTQEFLMIGLYAITFISLMVSIDSFHKLNSERSTLASFIKGDYVSYQFLHSNRLRHLKNDFTNAIIIVLTASVILFVMCGFLLYISFIKSHTLVIQVSALIISAILLVYSIASRSYPE